MKKIIVASCLAVFASFVILFAQGAGTGTPRTLRVLTDANNYLMASAAAQTLPLSQPTQFSNTRLATDAKGYLLITHVNGTLFWENTNLTTTGGGSIPVATTAYSLPAGTMGTNGDRLVIDIVTSVNSTSASDSKSCVCNIGYSAFNTTTGGFTGGLGITIHSTVVSTASISMWGRAIITRLSATSQSVHSYTAFEGTSANQQNVYAAASTVTWGNANNILCALWNASSGTQLLTLNEIRITYEPR